MTQAAINAINKFKAGVKGAFAKHIQSGTTFDPSNSTIFEDAVAAAYGDAKRTFKGINGRAATANKNLAETIKKYFEASANPTKFDGLHNDWCEYYIADLKNAGYDKATYGRAQKVVNMTFKYLYCLDNAAITYDDHFEKCHVALDSYTLEWIRRNCEFNNNEKYDDWSKIQYVDTPKKRITYVGYKKIVDRYREKIPKNFYAGCTPFQAEFIFWPEIQMHRATEAFYFALNDNLTDEEKKDFINKDLNDKKAEIKNHL